MFEFWCFDIHRKRMKTQEEEEEEEIIHQKDKHLDLFSPIATLTNTGTSSSADHLPNTVIEEILSKCPVKSAIRFKSVSKSWQSIISDTRFCRIDSIRRRSHPPENENMFMLLAPCTMLREHIYMIRWEDDETYTTQSTLPYPSPSFKLPLCSCDGLILFGQSGNNRLFLLWNPSVRNHVMISGPHAASSPWLHHFYYDPITDEHKIVFVYERWYAVYSCKKRSWSEMKGLPCDLNLIYGRGVSVDGCFYALAGEGEIVCFDSRDGNLHKFRQPKDVEVAVGLTEVSGRLYFFGYLRDGGMTIQMWAMEKHGSFEKWVMDKNGSLKKWCFPWRKVIDTERKEVVQLWLKNNVSLLVKKVTDNPHKRSRFQESESEFDLDVTSRIFPYSENLYLPRSNILAPEIGAYGDIRRISTCRHSSKYNSL